MTIEQALSKYHWIKLGEDGVLELYLDHHSLSSFRQCEAYFELSILNSIRGKGREWSLELGILFHKMLEIFYERRQAGAFDLQTWLADTITYWLEFKMDEFSEHKTYKALGGLTGFITLLTQYADFYNADTERLRIIGMEIPFGKDREVFLGQFTPYPCYKENLKELNRVLGVRCYLTGRIDFLMDSGTAIGPLDHKTFTFFKGNPGEVYDPQEGMTGYVYAARAVVAKHFPELMRERKLDRIWLNCVQITPPADKEDYNKRFKRIPLLKTDYQLETWRLRQLRTFSKIYDLVIGGAVADWNTSICANMFHRDCPFKNLHRQNGQSNLLTILNADFIQGEPWNPETIK